MSKYESRKPDPKPSLSLFPPVAHAHAAHALQDGNVRPGRGAYNWRHGVEVRALAYADKAQRHIDLWKAGERAAPDSKVHHLGCAIADLAIILDCEAQGLLVDDRQNDNGALQRVYDEIGKLLTKAVRP